MNAFIITVINGSVTRYTKYGNPSALITDGFVAEDVPGARRKWYVQNQVRYGKRWLTADEAANVAVEVAALYPDMIGSLRVDEVERTKVGWRRVRK